MYAYEQAIRANPNSIQAMNSISAILRTREDFPKAIEYLNQILKIDTTNGEAWGSLGQYTLPTLRPVRFETIGRRFLTNTPCAGHCYLMMDDLQQAYAAYQNALINLRNPKVYIYICHPHSRRPPTMLTYLPVGT